MSKNCSCERVVSPCCCNVRKQRGERKRPNKFFERLHAIYERLEFFLLIISGLSLIVSFFHLAHDFLFFDPAWFAILISGVPFFINAIRNLFFLRRVSVDTLLSTAIVATIISEWFFPSGSKSAGGHVHSYIFAGGEVAFIMALGHYLEEWTVSRARAGIEALLKLAPKTARRINNVDKVDVDKVDADKVDVNKIDVDKVDVDKVDVDKVDVDNIFVTNNAETIIPVSDVCSGDLLRVLPGEAVPVDGIIVTGNTSIDQSLITGESLPVDLFEGDSVYGGTVNCFGSFVMRATRVGEDASISNMIRLVCEAEQKKANVERIADSWASFLVPMAIVTALVVGFATFIFGIFWGGSGVIFWELVEDAASRAVTILVVFCPCSLVLATPTAIVAAIGNASRCGILIRSGEAIEQLAKVNIVAFDKTGTLTRGEPQLKMIYSSDVNFSERELLRVAASVEVLSEHPLAKCIVAAARSMELQLSTADSFELFRGEGICARLSGNESNLIVGNDRILKRFNVTINSEVKSNAESRFIVGETVIWVVVGLDVVGFVSVADVIRLDSCGVVENLLRECVDVMLLTGDNSRAAKGISELAGIELVKSGLLPEEKVMEIENVVRSGGKIAMIGDGINDAPALKAATVGIAMGKVGSDLTIDAADVVLMGDDLAKLPFLLKLARKTRTKIISNIWISMSINAVAIVLATTGFIGPVVGALVHNAGSIAVVLNASLLLKTKK
ncbi:MAG: cation-translocating P-type ATPase [Planctomycetaceae bacterium]|jgi:heavy metal translocating P-type ATPase|nr:cation-translocating P-type ATPase [Planctomycetaceae bacterium]